MAPIKSIAKFMFLTGVIIISSCLKKDDTEFTQERENLIISEYIDSLIEKGLDVETTASGMFYTIIKEGEDNIKVQPGDSIGINYVGSFPESGIIFDASDYHYEEDGLWKYTYKSVDLIAGFDEAVGLLSKGSEGMFLIPSGLAYGSKGSWDGSIPPYSPLVFKIKLVEIYR